LLQYFLTPEGIQSARQSSLESALGEPWQRQAAGVDSRAIQQDLAWLQKSGNRLITYGEVNYPQLLTHIPDPPLALFCTGQVGLLNDPAVAIVGSRAPTPAGSRLISEIAAKLAASGLTIVSGLALGIDGAAHQGALDANGSTIAVMGCGLDVVYPARHRPLFETIGARGCLISEFPLGVGVSRYNFPKRNRLVSGLALGTLVVEAATKSGTLITARLAMEQNRSVMAIPGSPLSRQYRGSHELLKQGATLVTCAEDVLQELNLPLREALNNAADMGGAIAASGPEETILDLIFHQSTSVDSIITASGLTAAEVSSMLLTLELQGLVSRARDGGYIKVVAD
jgi:DNA processing protein